MGVYLNLHLDSPTLTLTLSLPHVHVQTWGQEHFLKEIESIRRRLLELESTAHKATTEAGPDATPEKFRWIAREEASAKAEEVRVKL